MAPKQARGAGRGRGKGRESKGPPKTAAPESPESSNPFESSDEQRADDGPTGAAGEAEAEARAGAGARADEADKTIPPELLTRVLHEFFARDATRISRDANAAVGKYVDVFVREAIARAAVEKKGGFLEVEDLEKIAPQLLLDL